MQNRDGTDVTITIDRNLECVVGSESQYCIFKVHNVLRNVNKRASEPEIIAIGPFHRGKSHLQMIEKHKLRFLKLLVECKNGQESTYFDAVKRREEDARKCYAEPIDLSSDQFVEIMVLDGCFIIELLRKNKMRQDSPGKNDLPQEIKNDPLFRSEWPLISLQRDLMLFENQLPFFILTELYQLANETVQAQLPDETIQTQLPEETAQAELPGETIQLPNETVQLPGETAQAELPDEMAQAELPGETAQAELPGEMVPVQLPNETTQAELPGETVQLPGETVQVQLPNETVQAKFPSETVQLPGETVQAELQDETAQAELPSETVQLPNETVQTQLPGETAQAELPGEMVPVQLSNETAQAELPGETIQLPDETVQLSNETVQTELPGETVPGQENNFTSLASAFFNDLFLGYGKCRKIGVQDKIKHLLDLIHRYWSSERLESNRDGTCNMDNINLIRCSTELAVTGIKFQKIDGEVSLFDLQFSNGLLQIPAFAIEDRTESFLRNLMAYEQYCGDPKYNIVTDYMTVFSCLIKSAEDVKKLSRDGIVRNFVGDDAVIYRMVNEMNTHIVGPSRNFHYAEIFKSVNIHCERRWNKWMAILRRKYANSSWGIISIIAASTLLVLGFLQALFQILSWKQHS